MAVGSPDPGEKPDARVGALVAQRYRILARIGEGGMGAIYEAEQLTTSKRFAVKTLHPEFGRITEVVRRFEREAKAASLLNHPGIVSVTDFGTLDDGALFFVMELVRGRSLGDLLDARTLADSRRSLVIVRRVLEALAHAHAHGVIHRDLKPDNVMLLDAGESEEERDIVKLVDFGIAKVVGEAEAELGGEKLTQAGVTFGTPDYMAPEQALGEVVDARADLYAVGVILFEMLAGRKPFDNPDKMAVVRMQVTVAPPTLADAGRDRVFTPALEALVARALEKRREQRFASAEEMIAAVDKALASLDEPAPAPAPVPLATLTPVVAPPRARAAAPSLLGHPPRPNLTRLLVIGLPLLTLIVVVIVAIASGGDGDGKGATGKGRKGGKDGKGKPGLGLAIPPPLPAKTPRAERAEKLLVAGDAEGAVAQLEAELAAEGGARDAWGHLVLGHARARLDKDVEALAAYERALALAPALADDEVMRKNVLAMVDKKDKTAALAAFELAADKLGAAARARIAKVASTGKVKEVRRRAYAIAERDGFLGKVDRLASFTLDLQQGRTCADRRAAIPRIRALKDKAAIPALKKAANRSGGFLGLEDVNGCLERDANEAVEYLEGLP